MKAGQASVAQLTEALSNAHSAQRFFRSLADMAAPPLPRARLDQHLAFNTRQLEEARKLLHEVRTQAVPTLGCSASRVRASKQLGL